MMIFDLGQNNFTQAFSEISPIGVEINFDVGSSKTFTVPNNELWKITSAFVTCISSAVVGNRRIVTEVLVAGTSFGRVSAGAVQAANQTRYYQFLQGTFREASFINNELQTPFPIGTAVGAGATIKIYDMQEIDPTGDTVKVVLFFNRYKGVPAPT